jgi:subtilisin-like proprotein convertase family protein
MGNAFVNDLDLEVSVGGHTYRGNWLVDGESAPGGLADFRNNVENVLLPPGVSGRMSVKVVAKSLGGDGVPGNATPLDQDFALVVSNAQEQVSSPVLAQGDVTVDDAGVDQNGDGALEPGESFKLQQGVRNTGTDVATGVSGSLTGGAGLTVTQPDSGYADITADAEEENATPYEATLSGSADCGVDATGILDVTSTEGGTQPVPVTIPTGRPGPPTTHTKTQTVAIPDDNAGGVQSTLFVPVSGRIKDLDVRLDSIDHSFVGDLKVELTSPDNSTTVRLIEHVGGPNNGGDDLVDTIFDDEATTVIGMGTSAAPYTGRFRPQGDQLSRFDGAEQQGTWKLRVSDRYENDTGSLLGWSLTIRTAQCDPNVNAPETEIQAAPPPLAGSRNASFVFDSPRPTAQFQCRLDGGDFSPCSSPQQFGNLPEGTHTFEVRACDQYGNVDGSPAVYTWTVDVTAPGPQISNAGGEVPSVQGRAGTSSGDADSVTVELYSGSAASGSPVQTVVAPRDGSGNFGAQFERVGAGTYTARALQGDAAGNTGSSAPVSFTVAGPPPPGPSAFGASTLVTVRAARRVAARGPMQVVVTNANPFPVTGRLGARTSRKLATGGKRKRYLPLRAKTMTLAAGARQTIKLALPRALRTVLKRDGKVALRFTATLHDPAGNTRKVTARATPRAQAKRR